LLPSSVIEDDGTDTSSTTQKKSNSQPNDHEPWLIVNPADPKPDQPWYTPARYFARKLARDDVTLLSKPDILADKVLKILTKHGVHKRGDKPFGSSDTIKKAFVNVKFG
jgi:hypothetical protein